MKSFVIVTAAAAALVGCASTDTPATDKQPAAELFYRTGSNIPIRDRKPLTPEEKERQKLEGQKMLEAIQQSGPIATPRQ